MSSGIEIPKMPLETQEDAERRLACIQETRCLSILTKDPIAIALLQFFALADEYRRQDRNEAIAA